MLFKKVSSEKIDLCSVVTSSEGPRLNNLDGHWTLEISGFVKLITDPLTDIVAIFRVGRDAISTTRVTGID